MKFYQPQQMKKLSLIPIIFIALLIGVYVFQQSNDDKEHAPKKVYSEIMVKDKKEASWCFRYGPEFDFTEHKVTKIWGDLTYVHGWGVNPLSVVSVDCKVANCLNKGSGHYCIKIIGVVTYTIGTVTLFCLDDDYRPSLC